MPVSQIELAACSVMQRIVFVELGSKTFTAVPSFGLLGLSCIFVVLTKTTNCL